MTTARSDDAARRWDADPRMLDAIRRHYLDAPFLAWLGCELLDVQAGSAEVKVRLRPELLNRRGIPHGGVVATLLDTCMAQAISSVLPLGSTSLTVQLSSTFLAAGSGDALFGQGRVIERTRMLAMAESAVYAGDGTQVATGNAIFRVWLPKPADGAG